MLFTKDSSVDGDMLTTDISLGVELLEREGTTLGFSITDSPLGVLLIDRMSPNGAAVVERGPALGAGLVGIDLTKNGGNVTADAESGVVSLTCVSFVGNGCRIAIWGLLETSLGGNDGETVDLKDGLRVGNLGSRNAMVSILGGELGADDPLGLSFSAVVSVDNMLRLDAVSEESDKSRLESPLVQGDSKPVLE